MAVATRPPMVQQELEQVRLSRNSSQRIELPNCNPGWRPRDNVTVFAFLDSYLLERSDGNGGKVSYRIALVRTTWGGNQDVTFINDLGEEYTVRVIVR